MKFVLQRNYVVAGLGHAIEFEKGVATHVPPEMYALVTAAGAIPEDGTPVDLEPKKQVSPGAPADPDERKAAVFEAFAVLVDANDTKTFTAGGVPQVDAVTGLLGWSIEAKERTALWNEYQQAIANGD